MSVVLLFAPFGVDVHAFVDMRFAFAVVGVIPVRQLSVHRTGDVRHDGQVRQRAEEADAEDGQGHGRP